MINKDDLQFLKRRRKLNKLWSIVGMCTLIVLVLLYAWLFIKTPNLVNPFHVMKMIETNQLDISSMQILSVFCSVAIIALFITVGIVVMYGFGWASLERRYLRIMETLRKSSEQ